MAILGLLFLLFSSGVHRIVLWHMVSHLAHGFFIRTSSLDPTILRYLIMSVSFLPFTSGVVHSVQSTICGTYGVSFLFVLWCPLELTYLQMDLFSPILATVHRYQRVK